MSDAERPLTELIATAKAADPADRIQWRDPIAAHGAPAIASAYACQTVQKLSLVLPSACTINSRRKCSASVGSFGTRSTNG